MMQGHLDEVLGDYDGEVVAYGIDEDRQPGMFEEFRISRVPTLFVVHCGKILRQFVGLFPLAELKKFVADCVPRVFSCH